MVGCVEVLEKIAKVPFQGYESTTVYFSRLSSANSCLGLCRSIVGTRYTPLRILSTCLEALVWVCQCPTSAVSAALLEFYDFQMA